MIHVGQCNRACILNRMHSFEFLNVIASSPSGRPQISSSGMTFTVSRGDNVTMDCQFTANPVERIYKWQQFVGRTTLFMNTSDGHYIITPRTLSIYNITPDDANSYLCNVTNQCGSNNVAYILEVIGT